MSFRILKVNGNDVSNYTNCDTLELILRLEKEQTGSPEPLILEVKRQEYREQSSDLNKTITVFNLEEQNDNKTTAVQTENEDKLEEEEDNENSPQQSDQIRKAIATAEVITLYDESPSSEPRDSSEIHFEEITLRKTCSDERLGLTVAYSTNPISGGGSSSDDTNDLGTEVYISEIITDSVAHRDGRLRQGDQILQVNGHDVSTKEETELLFAENRNAVTLLVSRCLYQTLNEVDVDEDDEDEDVDDEEDEDDVDELDNGIPEEDEEENRLHLNVEAFCHNDQILKTPLLDNESIKQHMVTVSEEISALDTRVGNIILNKGDGFRKNVKATERNLDSQTKNITKTLESQQPPLPPTPISLNNSLSDFHKISSSVSGEIEHIYETIPEEDNDSYNEPNIREPIYCSPYSNQKEKTMVEQWLFSSRWRKKSNNNINFQPTESSANNNNNHLTLELGNVAANTNISNNKLSPIGGGGGGVGGGVGIDCKLCTKHKVKSPKHNKHPNDLVKSPVGVVLLPFPPPPPAAITGDTTMYTNLANLEQTILLQQKLLRKSINGNINSPNDNFMGQRMNPPTIAAYIPKKQFNLSNTRKHFTAPSLTQYQFVSGSNVVSGVDNSVQQLYRTSLQPRTSGENMEWKVKRRPDGTRYIVRRPIRQRLLKQRAIKINEERRGAEQTTTEDDTISEIKLGRYWSRDERKKHMEKSRERRQRQEHVISNKTEEIQQLRRAGSNVHPWKKIQSAPTNFEKASAANTAAASITTNNKMSNIGILSVTTV